MIISQFNFLGVTTIEPLLKASLVKFITSSITSEVETPSYDAGKGLYLKGNGDGTFSTHVSVEESGIFLPKNVKNLDLMFLTAEKRPAVLVANNNADLQLFIWTR